jgi:FMN phosphatase YigB (HAD superfamily)
MTIRNILLDGGGVILDETEHEESIAQLLMTLIRKHLPDYTRASLQADIDEAVVRFCPKVYSYILWKRIPDPEIYLAYRDRFLKKWRTPPLRLLPGIETQLPLLASEYRLALAGQYGREILEALEDHRLLQYFSDLATQDDFEITKPDPRYFERILARHGMRAVESVMVGDRIDNDVIPAKMIGMLTIRVRIGMHAKQEPRIPEEKPDIEISDVTQLATAVSALQAAER